MQLSYRGVRYNSHPVHSATEQTPVTLNYRGLSYRGVRHSLPVEATTRQAPVVTKYRGVSYRVPQVEMAF